jgi:hypothetical protein
VTTTAPALDFGGDLSTFAGADGAVDVDPLGPLLTGPRVALEGIARRLSTPRGALTYAGLPDYGYDLMALAAKRMSALAQLRAAAAIQQEAAKEQGVLGCTARVVAESNTTFRVELSVRLASGPYQLVLSVTDLSLTVLKVASG